MEHQRPTLNKREFATILAALRLWRSKIGPDRYPAQANSRMDFEAYFEDGERFAPLSKEEIDSLCERINVEDDEVDKAFRAAAQKLVAGDEGSVEVDDEALVSRADDEDGAYVEAWIWVEAPEESL